MRFLKVFRWIVFGFMLMFAVTAGFFALYYVPGGMFNQIIEEYLTNANLELQTTLYTYAGLAVVCLFFFILFSIIVKTNKRRREREYEYKSSSYDEEETEYDEEETEYSSEEIRKAMKRVIDDFFPASEIDRSRTFSSLTEGQNCAWDRQDSADRLIGCAKGKLAIQNANLVFILDPRKNRASGTSEISYCLYEFNKEIGREAVAYPVINILGMPESKERFLLVVFEKYVDHENMLSTCLDIYADVCQQVVSGATHLKTATGGISYAAIGDKPFEEIIMSMSIKDSIEEMRSVGYFSRFEKVVLSALNSDIEKDYMKSVFDNLHSRMREENNEYE